MMYRDLDGTLATFAARAPLEIEELGTDADQVEQALAAIPTAYRNDVAQRLAVGDRCWVARRSGELAYEAWAGVGSTYSYALDRRLPLESRDTTIYGAYTVPAARNLGIHSAVSSHVLAVMRQRGMGRIVILMEPGNLAALRMPAKLGFRTVGYTGFAEVCGIRLYFLRDRGFLSHVRPRHYWRKV